MPTWLRSRTLGFALAVSAGSTVDAAPARGGKPPLPTETAKPWEGSSTAEQRERAHEIFQRGNEHFFKRSYASALELYEQALALFDHPRIRLGIVRSLIWLGRPADAHAHLEAALRWGADPFDPEEYAEAVSHREVIARQVGLLVVRCRIEGARLTLDGKPLLECPGEVRRVVMPGPHQVVGRKAGYLTMTRDVVAEPAGEAAVDVAMRTLEDSAVRVRRWAMWKPWVIVGGGAVLALAAAPIQLKAMNDMDTFRERVEDLCGMQACAPPPAVLAIESRARLENRIAISLWIVSGAAVVSGLMMAYMNREHAVIPMEEQAPGRLAAAPVLTPDAVGLAVLGRF